MRTIGLIIAVLALAVVSSAQNTTEVCYQTKTDGVLNPASVRCLDITLIRAALVAIAATDVLTPESKNGDGTLIAPAVMKYKNIRDLVIQTVRQALIDKAATAPADAGGSVIQKAKAAKELAIKNAESELAKALASVEVPAVTEQ